MKKQTTKTDNYETPVSLTVEVGFEGILCESLNSTTDDFEEINNPYFG